MNTFIRWAALGAVAFSMQPAVAEGADPAATPPATTAQAVQTPEEIDKQLAKMREQMSRMQDQMSRIQQSKDPTERQRLLQDHWATMQQAMSVMHSTWGMNPGGPMMGGPMMGGPMMGGHMMGGPMMMWGDYRNLTPDQLRQRQYMMDQWMPMQQMMMDHMMWHQHWMMQPPPAPPKK
jgi:hypothetical protein